MMWPWVDTPHARLVDVFDCRNQPLCNHAPAVMEACMLVVV